MRYVVVVGRGKVGRSLSRALRAAGAQTRLVRGRSVSPHAIKDAEMVILAVPDGAIGPTAERIAPSVTSRTVVVHCAGARGVDELAACARNGAQTAAMHPLVSFADPRRSPELRGTTFVVQGEQRAVRAVRSLGRMLGVRVAVCPVHGAAYHAAAALVANGASALATRGVRVLERLGMERRAAERATGALLRTVADNVQRTGVPGALTGPVARGDAATVEAHRKALRRVDPGANRAYGAVGPAIIECAVEAGLPKTAARRVRRAFSSARNKRPQRRNPSSGARATRATRRSP